MTNLARISNVDDLPTGLVDQIRAGDQVRTGENQYPRYRVIATNGDRAWVRDIQYGSDHVVPLEHLHKI